jgi:hypothetical protein
MPFDRSELAPEWQRAFAYVESEVGGRIVAAERQPRWRPAWFLELERSGGDRAAVYFRGARTETPRGVPQLRHEFRCLQVLEKHGIPVPHLYGFCPDPAGIVMDKAPGRFNLATADSDRERVAVRDEYMEILARVHALPLRDFEAIGLKPLSTPRELALGDLETWVRSYRQAKLRPEPLLEFLIDWLERNVPGARSRVSFLMGDSGQFLFERGRVTAVIDLELAYIGDPAADLGALFSRDLSEPMGDLSAAIHRYEQLSGDAVDPRVVLYHAIRFALVTPLACAAMVANPPPSADFVQYLAWYLVYSRCPLEVVAHLEGIALDEPPAPPEQSTPWTVGHDALHQRFQALDHGDAFQAYQVDALARIAEYLRRADRYGAALETQDLDEAASLLGSRPSTWRERDEALEALVARNRGELDAELVRYFVRRVQRSEQLLRPVMRELEGARMQTLHQARASSEPQVPAGAPPRS